MSTSPRFTVILATLLRDSYPAAISSLRRQTFQDFQLMARNDKGNEYIARNRAAREADGEWLVFMDDDAVAPLGWLARLDATLRTKMDLVAVSGPLYGNMFGSGVILVDHPGWWIGTNLAVRKDVFLERPFEETWGLGRIPRGWRADSLCGDEPVLVKSQFSTAVLPIADVFSLGVPIQSDLGKDYTVPHSLETLTHINGITQFAPVGAVMRHRVSHTVTVEVGGCGKIRMTANHSLFRPTFSARVADAPVRRSSSWIGRIIVNGAPPEFGYDAYSEINVSEMAPVRPNDSIGQYVFIGSTPLSGRTQSVLAPPLSMLVQFDTPLNHLAVRYPGVEDDAIRLLTWEERADSWQWQQHRALPISLLISKQIDVDGFSEAEVITKGNHKSMAYPYPIRLSPSLLKFFGLWIADGSYHHSGVAISCADAGPLVAKVAAMFNATFRLGKNGIDWRIFSRFLSRLMQVTGFVGDSHTKRIPTWVFDLDTKQRDEFVAGYWMGDVGNTVSKSLAEDFRALLLLGGRAASVTRWTGLAGFSKGMLHTMYRIHPIHDRPHTKVLRFGDFYLGRVMSVMPNSSKEEYVYDLHIPNVSAFYTGSLLVHNTDLGFSLEQRYPGRWLHDSGWAMEHPGMMQSQWDPEVEHVFFNRWRKQYLDRFIRIDPRGQQFLLDTQILTEEERTQVLNARKELRKGMPNLPVLPQEA